MAAEQTTGAAPIVQSTRIFKRTEEKLTKAVFDEELIANTPPILGKIYLPKWWIGDCQSIEITITKNKK